MSLATEEDWVLEGSPSPDEATAASQVPAKTIVLIEFLMSGHHAGWLVQFAVSLLRAGFQVYCFCPDPEWMKSQIHALPPAMASRFRSGALAQAVFPDLRPKQVRSSAEAFFRWRAAAKAIRNAGCSPDLVFFAMFDSLLGVGLTPSLVDGLFPFPWVGLYFHPRYERAGPGAERQPFRRADFSLHATNCRGVAILDEGVADKMRRYMKSKPVSVLPDFVIPAEESPITGWISGIRDRAAGRTIVVAAGSLEKRKGISTLLRLSRREDAAEFFFVFAGSLAVSTFDAEELRMWEEASSSPLGNTFQHPERIESDSEFDQLIAAGDIVYAAYHNFRHSSNLLAKAARFRKPIIVSQGFCMEERARKYSLGAVVLQDDVADSLSALRVLREELKTGARSQEREEGWARYTSDHSVACFEARLAEMLPLAAVT